MDFIFGLIIGIIGTILVFKLKNSKTVATDVAKVESTVNTVVADVKKDAQTVEADAKTITEKI